MRQNNVKLIKILVILSSKKLEKKGWKVLVWENVRPLCNKRLPNEKKNKHKDLPKRSDLLWESRHERRLCQKTFRKSSMKSEDFQEVFHEVRRLNIFRKLPRRLPRSFPESNPNLKINISKLISEKHTYLKTFKWLQKLKTSGRLNIFTFI